MIVRPCPACYFGEHEKHVTHWGRRPEGIIDGEYCYCTGDCKPPEIDFKTETDGDKKSVLDMVQELRSELADGGSQQIALWVLLRKLDAILLAGNTRRNA